MIPQIFSPFRFLARAFLSQDSPKQLAMGVALGMVVGLVPKGNMTAAVLGIVFFSLRLNLGIGLLTALVFTSIGGLLSPVTHAVGSHLLLAEGLQPLWTWMYNTPPLPLMAFNNTVVLGSLVLGLALLYPTYRGSLRLIETYQPKIIELVKQYKVTRWLLRAETLAKLRG